MIDKELLSILACPETKKNLVLADDQTLAKINVAISQGKVTNKLKQKIQEQINGALFRVGDTKYIYPIRGGVPILLVEELIDVSGV